MTHAVSARVLHGCKSCIGTSCTVSLPSKAPTAIYDSGVIARKPEHCKYTRTRTRKALSSQKPFAREVAARLVSQVPQGANQYPC